VIVQLITHSVPAGEDNAGDLWVGQDTAKTIDGALSILFPDEAVDYLVKRTTFVFAGVCGAAFETEDSVDAWGRFAKRHDVLFILHNARKLTLFCAGSRRRP
jgi:hypothetical protein